MANTTLREYLQKTEDAISSGHVDAAMANCQHILSIFPDALEAQRLLGEVYLAQGQLEEAQQTFDWILANDPENVITYCDRALTSERLSDIDTALDCYQQAYELSRGNSQIRREFNQLSAKVGQQEFMFSRAGLARLYMRGDLLTQAIQEWEAVLNVSPGRLDARTGLLETYWREGTYDKVEQIASRILEEIPTCLKALLLLAYVTSTYNLERAKELILQAQALDPELVMAHELFSDLSASQPNDPFLALLKAEPIIFTDHLDEQQVSKLQTAINVAVEVNGSQSSAKSPDQSHSSSNLESWSEIDTRHAPQDASKPVDEASAFTFWSDATNVQNVDAWATNDQVSQSEPGADSAKSSSEFDHDFDPTILQQQPWFQADQLNTTTTEPEHASENLSSIGLVEHVHSWSTATQEDDFPTPPAWLDVLTKIDLQPADPIPTTSAQSPGIQEPLESVLPTQPQAEPEVASPKLWEDDLSAVPASPLQEKEQTFFFSTEDNTSDMQWPEWLKSLGAETMEPDPEPGVASVASEPQQSLAFPAWADQIDQTLSEPEKEQMSALEHLEHDLRSQGFVPLQPGTLSTLAEEPSLSSALAELGNFTTQPASPEQPDVNIQPASFMQSAESTEPAEPPSPLTLLAGNTQPGEPEPLRADTPNQRSDMPVSPATEQSINTSSMIPPASPTQEAAYAEATNQIFEPLATSVAHTSREAPLIPDYYADALLENELETTMKRPAVRLQSIQQSTAQPDTSSTLGRGHAGERGRNRDDNISSKERLLRGYQFQLAGAYDDAMQEYRIIIRNAPELLSEIISNVRALLKLTPSYSAGYRVLGDAYMRQGEYLQAMEAYNKALTIAKKAKSQSS
jgi:tetratricopeptide (TPR) repeat protein